MKARNHWKAQRKGEPEKVEPGKGRRKKVFVEPTGDPRAPAAHTIPEVAAALNKSRQTITRAIKKGQIRVLPAVGEQVRISHREYVRLTTDE
jgi:excisionase family DNA binding protein